MLGSNWDESNQVGVKLGFRFRVVDKIHICKLMLGPRIKFVATHCHILIHLHSPLSQTLGLDYKFAKNTKSILCKKKDFAAHQHSFWFLSPNSQSQPNANLTGDPWYSPSPHGATAISRGHRQITILEKAKTKDLRSMFSMQPRALKTTVVNQW